MPKLPLDGQFYDEDEEYPAPRIKPRQKRIAAAELHSRSTSRRKSANKRLDEEDIEGVESRVRSKPLYNLSEEVFKCRHCRRFVTPLPSGGHHRNHCPFCLYSRHVDDQRSGDRLSPCGASMAPIGHFQRPGGEDVIVHRCLGCGFERFNRIAADDDFDLVLSLPEVAPRTRSEIKAQRWAMQLEAQPGDLSDTI